LLFEPQSHIGTKKYKEIRLGLALIAVAVVAFVYIVLLYNNKWKGNHGGHGGMLFKA
jgi:hypothetical protein